VMLRWEQKQKKRVIFENKHAIAFAPFVSQNPFEIHVFPKKHSSHFEETPPTVLQGVTEVLQKVLQRMTRNMHDPDYNFFIHTTPAQHKKKKDNYHWHIEIFPKVTIRAGFELGTGIDINPIDPDAAAKILKK